MSENKSQEGTKKVPIQGRNWCYTCHDYLIIPQDIWPEDTLRYHVWQMEICPTTNKPHLQGYLSFKTNQRFKKLKEEGGDSFHWELRIGTHQQAAEYCKKVDTRVSEETDYEFGDIKQGERTDLQNVELLVKKGMTESEIMMEEFTSFIKYNRGISKAIQLSSKKRSWQPEVYVYWGEPGTGKSRKAYEENPDAYYKSPNSKWWDNYQGEKTIILDDYRNWFEESYLLQLCDRYPMMVEGKGTHHQMLATKIIFTSNHPPSQWFNNPNGNFENHPFHRRITEIAEFKKISKPKLKLPPVKFSKK